MAVSDRFQQAYRRLTGAFGAHHDAPRDPERVVELASARAALEDRRTDMKAARTDDGLAPFRRENPDWVDPRIGMGTTSRGAKLAALLGVVVLFGGLLLIVNEVGQWGVVNEGLEASEFDIEAEPTADGGCVVTVAGTLGNEGSGPIRVVEADFRAVDRDSGAALGTWDAQLERTYLEPGVTSAVTAQADRASCPGSPGGELRITYSEATGPLQLLTVRL